MYAIALVNMPFTGLQMPSLALTQLKARIDAELAGRVETAIHYLSHDFARRVGADLAQTIAMAHESQNAGLGDWIFRQAAFPQAADNSEAYFRRFFPVRDAYMEGLRRRVLEVRRQLPAILDELIDRHGLDRVDLVGFTSMFSQNGACFALARRLKERNPKIVVVMGGANCEPPMGPEIVRNVSAVDFAFAGPSLRSFPEFVRCCLAQEHAKCHAIRGVYSKENLRAGAAAATHMGEELDINTPVALHYDDFLALFEHQFEGVDVKPALLFETSRGCWWGERAHCTFCGLNGMTMAYRSMDPDGAVRLIRGLFRYAAQIDRIESVDNILPKSYLTEVLPRLDTPPHMCIFYEVKADLGESDIRTLADARVRYIQPGIEALATSTLKLMKKGTSSFQNLALLKGCASYGVFPAWNLLVGFPGEEEEIYRKYSLDIPLLVHLPPPSGVFPVRFDRYSPYFTKAAEYGLDLHPADYYEYAFPFEKPVLRNIAYHFVDRNLQAPHAVRVAKWIGKLRKRLNEWHAAWHQKGGERPALFFKPNGAGAVVHDTRSGKLVEHPVGATGQRILEHLGSPKRLSELAAAWDGPPLDAAGEVAALQARGLLFQEGERYLSLVLPQAPAVTHGVQ